MNICGREAIHISAAVVAAAAFSVFCPRNYMPMSSRLQLKFPLPETRNRLEHLKRLLARVVKKCRQRKRGSVTFRCTCLKEGSQYAGLDQTAPVLTKAEAAVEAAAEAYAKRLVVYDWNSAAHEKELLEKRKEEVEEAERAKRSKVVRILDLDGRKVLFNEDEVSEMESRNRILKPPDERQVFRIKPNPTIRIRPIFIDPSPTKKLDKA
ncbi:hypothetical protein NL676_008469 [Syzygium grande]|nr:hypothetical protein NL676_008469 [Syzygium grande]